MNSDPLLQILWKTEKRIINIDEIYTVNGIINDSKCEKNLSFLIKKKKKIVDCFCHTQNTNHKVDSQVKIPSFQRISTQNQFSSAR